VGEFELQLTFFNADTYAVAYLTLGMTASKTGRWSSSIIGNGALSLELTRLGSWFYLWLFSSLTFFGVVVYEFIKIGWKLIHQKMDFFSSGWNMVDLMCTSISAVYISKALVYLILLFDVHMQSPEYFMYYDAYLLQSEVNQDQITVITNLTSAYTAVKAVNTWLILLLFMRMAKFARFEGKIALTTRMLLRSAGELGHFLLVCFVFLLAFAFAGMASFGTVVDHFSTLGNAMETLFFLSFMDQRFDYDLLSEIEPVLSRMFVMVFYVVMGLILLNVFIAILMDSYAVIIEDPRMQYSLGDEVREGWERRLTPSSRIADTDDMLRVIEEDDYEGKYSYEQIVRLTKKPLSRRTDLMIRSLNDDLSDLTRKEVADYNTDFMAARQPRQLDPEDGKAAVWVNESSSALIGVPCDEIKIAEGTVAVELAPPAETVADTVDGDAGTGSTERSNPDDGVPLLGPPCNADPESLEESMDNVIHQYFERYDLDMSGHIDNEQEAKHLITNLIIKFKLASFTPSKIEETVRSMNVASNVSQWDKATFTSWFKVTVMGLDLPTSS